MLRAVHLVVFYAVLVWLAAMLLAGNLLAVFALLLPPRFRRSIVQRGISAVLRVFLAGCRLGGIMRLDLRALDVLNDDAAGMLITPNHPNGIDVFLVLSRVREARCLMSARYGSNGFFAIGTRLAGYIANAQPDEMVREAARAVDEGAKLLVFPEGTRTTQAPINPIVSGAPLIAKRGNVPMQIVFLRSNTSYLAKGWPIWKPPAFPMVFIARVGPRLSAPHSVADGIARLHEAFSSGLPASGAVNPRTRVNGEAA